jgi:hypothetical protein
MDFTKHGRIGEDELMSEEEEERRKKLFWLYEDPPEEETSEEPKEETKKTDPKTDVVVDHSEIEKKVDWGKEEPIGPSVLETMEDGSYKDLVNKFLKGQ